METRLQAKQISGGISNTIEIVPFSYKDLNMFVADQFYIIGS
jgi:hypothetical protein